MYTVVGRTPRTNIKPATVMGHKFPAGSSFKVFLSGIHRDQKAFKNANEYRPSRWEGNEVDPNSFFGFGAGVHNCIGQKMALIEIKVIRKLIVDYFD